MVVTRKKNHKPMDRYNRTKIKNFSPMINTIGQTSKIFNRWIDTFGVQHDRYYRNQSFNYSIKIKIVFRRSWANGTGPKIKISTCSGLPIMYRIVKEDLFEVDFTYLSIVGSVVECSPATRAARVRFPDDAEKSFLKKLMNG
jgi:hypothetical protein